MYKKGSRALIVVAVVLSLIPGIVFGASGQVELPLTLVWSAYSAGSSGYGQSVAIGETLKERYRVNLRVLPESSDVLRDIALRDGRAQFSANGLAGVYFAQEGLYDFGAPDWGPQPVRVLILNNNNMLLAIGTARDANIKKMADLKGKRVAWVVGAPVLNQSTTALLAFANLSWRDVKKIEFDSFAAAMDGIVNNHVDAAFTNSISGRAYQVEKSPRGLLFPPIPHSDKAGWNRLHALAPFFVPIVATDGAAVSQYPPLESAGYPYPVLMTYKNQNVDLVYNMTKAMVQAYPDYKDKTPNNNGWDIKRQIFQWVVPWHEGAIEYYKEIGAWKPEYQAHNEMLIKRQQVLAEAWASVKRRKYDDDAAFTKAWMRARAIALTKAGMNPVITRWTP